MIRLLIADDQVVVRAGLAVILGQADDVEVVGEAADGAEAVRLARELRPDVVCMDIRMPGTDGIAATRALVSDPALDVGVLVLTTFDVDDDVFAALEAGAAGFLLKGTDEATLLDAVRSVAEGRGTLDQRLTRRILQEFSHRRSGAARTPASGDRVALTARELDVLRLLAQGLSNHEIGRRLFIEPTTVKYHLTGLMQKSGSRDRLQVALWGIRGGHVPLDDPGS